MNIVSDHSKSLEDFKKMGIPVWQPYLGNEKTKKKQFGSFNVIRSTPFRQSNTDG